MGIKAIVNAKIVTCFCGVIDKGILLWDDNNGKIIYCGNEAGIIPEQAQILNMDGCVITPGFIDAILILEYKSL